MAASHLAVEAVLQELKRVVEERRSSAIVLELSENQVAPITAGREAYVSNRRSSMYLPGLRLDVLRTRRWMQEAVPDHPALGSVVRDIENDPLVATRNEVEVPTWRGKVPLHYT